MKSIFCQASCFDLEGIGFESLESRLFLTFQRLFDMMGPK
ncbi:hypothetical protein SORDD20_00899 [Streptococcus oralis]|nr:hypothetical protein SORDD20_00899 [Streptococcus oralis]